MPAIRPNPTTSATAVSQIPLREVRTRVCFTTTLQRGSHEDSSEQRQQQCSDHGQSRDLTAVEGEGRRERRAHDARVGATGGRRLDGRLAVGLDLVRRLVFTGGLGRRVALHSDGDVVSTGVFLERVGLDHVRVVGLERELLRLARVRNEERDGLRELVLADGGREREGDRDGSAGLLDRVVRVARHFVRFAVRLDDVRREVSTLVPSANAVVSGVLSKRDRLDDLGVVGLERYLLGRTVLVRVDEGVRLSELVLADLGGVREGELDRSTSLNDLDAGRTRHLVRFTIGLDRVALGLLSLDSCTADLRARVLFELDAHRDVLGVGLERLLLYEVLRVRVLESHGCDELVLANGGGVREGVLDEATALDDLDVRVALDLTRFVGCVQQPHCLAVDDEVLVVGTGLRDHDVRVRGEHDAVTGQVASNGCNRCRLPCSVLGLAVLDAIVLGRALIDESGRREDGLGARFVRGVQQPHCLAVDDCVLVAVARCGHDLSGSRRVDHAVADFVVRQRHSRRDLPRAVAGLTEDGLAVVGGSTAVDDCRCRELRGLLDEVERVGVAANRNGLDDARALHTGTEREADCGDLGVGPLGQVLVEGAEVGVPQSRTDAEASVVLGGPPAGSITGSVGLADQVSIGHTVLLLVDLELEARVRTTDVLVVHHDFTDVLQEEVRSDVTSRLVGVLGSTTRLGLLDSIGSVSADLEATCDVIDVTGSPRFREAPAIGVEVGRERCTCGGLALLDYRRRRRCAVTGQGDCLLGVPGGATLEVILVRGRCRSGVARDSSLRVREYAVLRERRQAVVRVVLDPFVQPNLRVDTVDQRPRGEVLDDLDVDFTERTVVRQRAGPGDSPCAVDLALRVTLEGGGRLGGLRNIALADDPVTDVGDIAPVVQRRDVVGSGSRDREFVYRVVVATLHDERNVAIAIPAGAVGVEYNTLATYVAVIGATLGAVILVTDCSIGLVDAFPVGRVVGLVRPTYDLLGVGLRRLVVLGCFVDHIGLRVSFGLGVGFSLGFLGLLGLLLLGLGGCRGRFGFSLGGGLGSRFLFRIRCRYDDLFDRGGCAFCGRIRVSNASEPKREDKRKRECSSQGAAAPGEFEQLVCFLLWDMCG